MDQTQTQEFEIFRAGRHTATDGTVVEVTHADLAAIADSYDPALGEAPLVVGHPVTNAPAYGWAKKLTARDGLLFATAGELDPAFKDAVNAGRYKKRSVSLFRPNQPGNPKPDRLYLKHIGFLGAAPPSVPGLRDVSFAAPGTTVEFAAHQPWWVLREIASLFRRMRDVIVARDGVEAADAQIPSYQIESINEAAQVAQISQADVPASFTAPIEETAMTQATLDFAARAAALDEREAALAAREQAAASAAAAAAAAQRLQAALDFTAPLVADHRLLPCDQPGLAALLARLEAEPATLDFAAADGTAASTPPAQLLREFLGRLPVQTPKGEIAAGQVPDHTVDFAAPPGVGVDQTRLELHQRAIAYQRQHPAVTYLDAVAAVGGR